MKIGSVLLVIAFLFVAVYVTFHRALTASYAQTGSFSTDDYRIENGWYVWTQSINESVIDVNHLNLKTVNGKIRVRPHEDESIQDVEVVATIRLKPAWLSREQDVIQAKSLVGVDVKQSNKKISIMASYPKKRPSSVKSMVVDLEVRMPSTTPLQAETVNGQLDVAHLQRDLELSTVNGKIEAKQCQGSISVTTVNGSIHLDGIGSLKKANTVNGSIQMAYADHFTENCTIETVNGSVKILYPHASKFDVDLQVLNGSIRINDDSFQGRKEKRHWRGSVRGGGSMVHVETVNGSITFQPTEKITQN